MADISTVKAREIISDFFSSIPAAAGEDLQNRIVLLDDCYSPISLEELLAITREVPLELPVGAPKTQFADCDDYALHLKAAATVKYRMRYFEGEGGPLPPAVAILMSQNHVLNLFIAQDGSGKNRLWCIDTSTPERPVTDDPARAVQMMKKTPVRLIEM